MVAARDGLGLAYTTLGYHNGPGYLGATTQQPEGAKHYPHTEFPAEPDPASP